VYGKTDATSSNMARSFHSRPAQADFAFPPLRFFASTKSLHRESAD